VFQKIRFLAPHFALLNKNFQTIFSNNFPSKIWSGYGIIAFVSPPSPPNDHQREIAYALSDEMKIIGLE